MIENQGEFIRFVKLLNDNDCLEHVVLIGSWAEYLYSELGILDGYDANIRTLDIDFLVKNMRKPNQPINILSLAKDAGLFVEADRLNGITKIIDPAGLEIEFLIAKKGQGVESSVKTNLGVTAESLRHLDILSKHTSTVSFLNISIEIPKPEAFVIHKMIINSERKGKAEKDQLIICSMYPYLDKGLYSSIKNTLTKKDLVRVNEFENNYILPMLEQKSRISAAKQNLSKANDT